MLPTSPSTSPPPSLPGQEPSRLASPVGPPRRVWRGYALAVGIVLAMTGLRFVLQPWLGETFPFLTFFPAAFVAGWYGGLGPGLLATALSAAVVANLFEVQEHPGLTGLVVFVVIGTAMAWLAESRLRSQAQAATLDREARKAASTEQLEGLVVAASALITQVSLTGVLERVVKVAARVIGAQYAAIGVLAPDGRLLESFTTYGIDDELRAKIGPPPRGHGILGLVIREARPIRLPDLARHPDSYGFPPHHPPMHSFLGVPIVGKRGVFGNLYLTEKFHGQLFTEEDEHVALLLAANTAAAVENAQLHEESARLLQEVQQLHRARERFFAMVNHELRNALAAVHGWSEMLVRKKDPATVPKAAFEVLDSAQQAVKLINDLLDLSRLDEDRLRPVIRATEPGSMARRAFGRVTPAAEAKRVLLQLEAAPQLPSCNTDASRVEQILVNLLGNAIQHAPDGSTVRLNITSNNGKVAFTLEDQGSGIEENDVEGIFDIYVTKAAGESRGVGLGLPLSRRLARLLGGELRAVARPGQGGCFVLELPATKEHEETFIRASAAVHPGSPDSPA